MPEQTLGGIPLGLGMVMKINFLNFHVHVHEHWDELSPLANLATVWGM